MVLILTIYFMLCAFSSTRTQFTSIDKSRRETISDKDSEAKNYHSISERSLLRYGEERNDSQLSSRENETKISEEHMCTPPSIKEFPADLFTDNQRRHGAVMMHVLVSMYMFIALAFVCDDYFVASLDHICENLNLSEDVAGATFMAVGGSAPELFTSIIGLFVIGYGDVGPGTIVGSAVFNILVALALVSLFAGQVTKLTHWPMCRDSFSYSVAVAALIGVMYDGFISWYESVILLLLYVCYCLLMRFNDDLQKRVNKGRFKQPSDMETDPLTAENADFGKIDDKYGAIPDHWGNSETYRLVTSSVRRLTWRDVGMMVMLSSKFNPATRFRAACYMITMRLDGSKRNTNGNERAQTEEHSTVDVISNLLKQDDDHLDIKIEAGPFYLQEKSFFGKIFWIISQPIVLVLRYTIPDCKEKRWARWYMATFSMSILWIGVLSYILVWMVVIIGYTLRIPDVIMGLTFLAAGTSVPDALASLLVARQGQGDMAVANSIGSNVFDILIGLALPWFLQTCLLHPGTMVKVNSRGLIYSVILLFATVIITMLSIHLNKWTLDRKTGVIFILAYFIFITFSSLVEFNVFGFVNLPTCMN